MQFNLLSAEPKTLGKKGSNCHEAEKEFLKRGRSLLVVVSSPPNETLYRDFTKQVAEFNKRHPFNFTLPTILVNYQKVS